jgi:hypothetical protein
VLLFANVIREPSDSKQVRRTVKLDAVFKGKAFAHEDFVGDGPQRRVSKNQFAQDLSLSPVLLEVL